jgi:hypothetical protein
MGEGVGLEAVGPYGVEVEVEVGVGVEVEGVCVGPYGLEVEVGWFGAGVRVE